MVLCRSDQPPRLGCRVQPSQLMYNFDSSYYEVRPASMALEQRDRASRCWSLMSKYMFDWFDNESWITKPVFTGLCCFLCISFQIFVQQFYAFVQNMYCYFLPSPSHTRALLMYVYERVKEWHYMFCTKAQNWCTKIRNEIHRKWQSSKNGFRCQTSWSLHIPRQKTSTRC